MDTRTFTQVTQIQKVGAKKKGRTARRVRQTRNTGRRAQTKACARQGSTTQRVLHPETRRAAREQVGAETTGRTTRRVLQPQKTGRRAQPQACARQGSTTQMSASPSNPTRRTRESGHFKERGAQPDGCVNTGTRGGAHNQRRAPDRGARCLGCFTQKPDTREL